jgi:hypothetical protein
MCLFPSFSLCLSDIASFSLFPSLYFFLGYVSLSLCHLSLSFVNLFLYFSLSVGQSPCFLVLPLSPQVPKVSWLSVCLYISLCLTFSNFLTLSHTIYLSFLSYIFVRTIEKATQGSHCRVFSPLELTKGLYIKLFTAVINSVMYKDSQFITVSHSLLVKMISLWLRMTNTLAYYTSALSLWSILIKTLA